MFRRNFVKSFAEFQYHNIILFFLSEFLNNSCIDVTSWVFVAFFALKPCCQSYSIVFVSVAYILCMSMRQVYGLYFPTVLNIDTGTTFACCQSLEPIEKSSDFLKK